LIKQIKKPPPDGESLDSRLTSYDGGLLSIRKYSILIAERNLHGVCQHIGITEGKFTGGIGTLAELDGKYAGVNVGYHTPVDYRFLPPFVRLELYFASDDFLDVISYVKNVTTVIQNASPLQSYIYFRPFLNFLPPIDTHTSSIPKKSDNVKRPPFRKYHLGNWRAH